jgi:hypothetical protein
MTGEQAQAVALVAAGLGARWAWLRWRVSRLTRTIDRADARRWQHLRRFW